MNGMKKLFAAALISAGFACGEPTSSTNPDSGTIEMRGDYPTGPYGKSEGSIIESVSFTRLNGDPFELEAVWKDDSRKLLLITTAAGWCVACIDEQPELRAYHETYGPKGLFILEAIFQDSNFNPATPQYADNNWKRQYNLPFEVVADVDFKLGTYYEATASPMNMIVDVANMKILRVSTGFDPNATEAILSARLQ